MCFALAIFLLARTPHGTRQPTPPQLPFAMSLANEMPDFFSMLEEDLLAGGPPGFGGSGTELHDAAMEGSAESTAAILATGLIDIDEPAPETLMTALSLAAVNGHSHVVTILLRNGSDTSAVNVNGATALHGAAQKGKLAVVKMLVEAGASAEEADDDDNTPLHVAAIEGHPKVLRAMIEAGADPNVRIGFGATPLMSAVFYGQLGALRELLLAGANPLLAMRTSGVVDTFPLVMAAQHEHTAILGELIRHAGLRGCGGDSVGTEALRLAAKNRDVDAMTILIDAGVVDSEAAALFVAAEIGPVAAVKLLLRHKEHRKVSARRAYLNSRDSSGSTPLLYGIIASRPWSPRIMRLLIEAGADATSTFQVKTSWGAVVLDDTPLGFAMNSLHDKVAGHRDATMEQMFILRRIRRLLLQVEAVRAMSWRWPSDAVSAAQAVESAKDAPAPSGPRTPALPLMRREDKARHALWATMFRWVMAVIAGRSVRARVPCDKPA